MLSQAEADALLTAAKRFVSPRLIRLAPGADETHDLIGTHDGADETFLLDLWRGVKKVAKLKYQTRGRKVIVLAPDRYQRCPAHEPRRDWDRRHPSPRLPGELRRSLGVSARRAAVHGPGRS